MVDPRRAVLCLLVIGVDNTILNVALPSIVEDLGRQRLAAAVDRRRLHDRVRRPAADRRLARRPVRPQEGAHVRPRPVRHVLGAGVAAALADDADLAAGAHGHRRRVHLPDHAVDPHQHLPGRGSGPGPSASGPASPASASPSARSAAACCSSTSGGARSSSSTSRSCIAALVLGRFLVPDSKDPEEGRLDPLGAVLSIVALVGLLFGIIEAPDEGWASTAGARRARRRRRLPRLFAAWELHTEHPMLDVRFFKNPRFSAASATITLTYFALFGSTFLLTQYFQFVLGYSPLKAGLMTAPVAVGLMVGAPSGAPVRRPLRHEAWSSSGSARSWPAALLLRLDTIMSARGAAPRPPRVRPRHGAHHGAGHRVDHGLAAAGQGGRGLGGERHDPPDRRRARRRRARQHLRLRYHAVVSGALQGRPGGDAKRRTTRSARRSPPPAASRRATRAPSRRSATTPP